MCGTSQRLGKESFRKGRERAVKLKASTDRERVGELNRKGANGGDDCTLQK